MMNRVGVVSDVQKNKNSFVVSHDASLQSYCMDNRRPEIGFDKFYYMMQKNAVLKTEV
jgi:hypothetical protein